MAVPLETLTELVADAKNARTQAEAEVQELNVKIEALRQEEDALRAVLSRRMGQEPSQLQPPATSGVIYGSWADLSRTEAVYRAVGEITGTGRPASPSEIETVLASHRRTDDRDQIGGALAYLRRDGRIHRLGRGRWGMGPEMTSEGTVGAVPSDSVTTERFGGDENVAPPTVQVQDHDQLPGGNARDLDRQTDNPVVQF
jgi:hypothetical protein